MTREDDVERLRRVAYGPGSSVGERAEAESALRALAAGRAAPADAAGAGPAAEAEVLASLEDNEIESAVPHRDDDEVATPIWERRILVGWVVPVVVVALLVGVLGTLQVTGQLGPKSPPEVPVTIAPTGPPSEWWIQMPGDLQAADAWFDGPATASDAYPFKDLLTSNGIDPYDVRFALAGGGGWNVWVGRSADRKLCLLIADVASESGAAGCFERARFAINGAHLAMGDRIAHWFGAAVMTSPTSGSTNEPGTAPVLPQPADGNVDAALAWFADSPAEEDEFPHPEALADLGILGHNVRKVFAEAPPGPAVWVAKREVNGFCLIMTEWPSSTASACATVDEFRESGLRLEARGFSASWDGESVAAG